MVRYSIILDYSSEESEEKSGFTIEIYKIRGSLI